MHTHTFLCHSISNALSIPSAQTADRHRLSKNSLHIPKISYFPLVQPKPNRPLSIHGNIKFSFNLHLCVLHTIVIRLYREFIRLLKFNLSVTHRQKPSRSIYPFSHYLPFHHVDSYFLFES